MTKSEYVIGKIIMIYGRKCSLIEVKRENRSLKILIFVKKQIKLTQKNQNKLQFK